MNKKEFIKKALDTTNAFFSTQAEAVKVNPKIWDYKLREYEEKALVVTPLAEQYDFRTPGVDMTVTVDETPSAAGALTETVDVTISSFATRSVAFTPTEYGAAYQLTRKEAVRAFFNVAERMVKKLGYSMADKKDSLGVAALLAGAGNEVIVNSKTYTTLLASTDTLNYDAITRGIKLNEEDKYFKSDELIIGFAGKQHLLNLGTINKANEFGSRSAIANGLIGSLFGLNIYVSSNITTTTQTTGNDYQVGYINSPSITGERPFGYAVKRDPMIEKEYHARGRFWDIVGHEEYQFQVLHPNGVCKVNYAV